jgi:mannose-1-phosphate guanylyltransferase
MSRWTVVLAGGTGSRFWPMSTPVRPKQLLPLVGTEPMLAATTRRLAAIAPPERTLILTNASLVEPIARLLPQIPRENLIAEPAPAGTAAALAWAAHIIEQREGRDAVMVCVHADWAIGDEAGFRAALDRAANAAVRHNALVTVGVVPQRPDPGFGYIQPGAAVEGDPDARRVARFVEKPDQERAKQMCEEGYLWNSGIFVWRAGDYLDEIRAHTPEVAPALAKHTGSIEEFFAAVKPVSVDVGVMERTLRVVVLPGDFGWDDVGTWAALHRVRAHDESANAVSGEVYAVKSSGNVVHAEDTAVIMFGVSDLIVVSRPGLTLVSTRDGAAELKVLLDQLPAEVRDRA